jgi:hypothetical protein
MSDTAPLENDMPKSDSRLTDHSGRRKAAATISSILASAANTPQQIASVFRRRYPTIAVTGMSGVGKTRLVDTLTKRNTAAVSLEIGSTNMERRTRQSSKFRGFRFLVVPGNNAATRLAALEEVFHDHPVDGVIHVVANGYATPRRFNTGSSDSSFSRDELLAAELEDWTITAHRIAAMAVRRESPIWLVIAVTKTDLYPDEVDKALDYYSPNSGSPFGTKLDELQSLVGGAKIWVDVLPVCAPPGSGGTRAKDSKCSEQLDTLTNRLQHLSGQL